MNQTPHDLLVEVSQKLEFLREFGAVFGSSCQEDIERAAILVHDVLFTEEVKKGRIAKSQGFLDPREAIRKIEGDE